MPEGGLNSLDLEVVGTFRSFSKEYDDRAVRVPLAAAQTLLATGGAHTVVVALDDTARTDEVLADLRGQLPAGEFEVAPWYEVADFYQKTVELYRGQFGVLQLIVLVMVVLGVANSVNTTLYERTGEFGTMLALGNRRREVFRLAMARTSSSGSLGRHWAACSVSASRGPCRRSASRCRPAELGAGLHGADPSQPLPGAYRDGDRHRRDGARAILPARRAARLQIATALRENV